MLPPDIFLFLEELKENNHKEWFDNNRERYQQIRQSVLHLAEIMVHEIGMFDKLVYGLEAKDCTYRINRDIRFSADKSPYKTHTGIFVCPGGKNSGMAGYYLHIEPGNSFIGGGVYMPQSPALKAIREEIYENYEGFLEVITSKPFLSNFGEFYGEKLKTKPKGFPESFPGIEFLKLKHFTVIKNLSNEVALSEKLLDEIRNTFTALYPLNNFMNQALREKFQ
ncbi:MAG: DUF2461 domain-containing protein [Bacteroidales bacterium]|nr:DUF2461 domain-containing protein [Bacteroidales bacterium]